MIGKAVKAPADGTRGTVVKYDGDDQRFVVVVWSEPRDWQYEGVWDGQITIEAVGDLLFDDAAEGNKA